MHELPADLPADLSDYARKRLLAGLIRAHSQWLEKRDLAQCVRDSYDVFVAALKDASCDLTSETLNETIAGWVYDWAVSHEWTPYPPVIRTRYSVSLNAPTLPPAFEPIPETEFDTTLGKRKIPSRHRREFMSHLESRIAHWQAEELMPSESASDGKICGQVADLIPKLSPSIPNLSIATSEPRDDPAPQNKGLIAEERSALLSAFKAKGRTLGIKITDEMIAKAAKPGKWNTRTMVTWWKRDDAHCKPPHDRLIRSVLAKDPASLWPSK